MSLADELQQTMNHVRTAAPAELVAQIGAVVAALEDSGIASRGVAVGDHVSLPTLGDMTGQSVDLAALNAAGPLVISFYRGGWCPFCNLEMRALQRIHDSIRGLGAELIAITPDLPAHAATTASEAGITFNVLHDAGLAFARTLGLAYSPDATMRGLNAAFGLDLMVRNGVDNDDLLLPATLVLDETGHVAWLFKAADWTQRGEPADILAALAALQPA